MLLINLDYKSKLSIYEQIVSTVEKYVAVGILKPNDKMPPIRSLASSLGINPNTVKKAYDILERKKVITTISTKGTYITDNTDLVLKEKQQEMLNNLEEYVKALIDIGITKNEIIEKIKKDL